MRDRTPYHPEEPLTQIKTFPGTWAKVLPLWAAQPWTQRRCWPGGKSWWTNAVSQTRVNRERQASSFLFRWRLRR